MLPVEGATGVMRLRYPYSSMTISEGDALITLLLEIAPSTRRIGKSLPFGGYVEVASPISQIEVPVSSVQKLVCAVQPMVRLPEKGCGRLEGRVT